MVRPTYAVAGRAAERSRRQSRDAHPGVAAKSRLHGTCVRPQSPRMRRTPVAFASTLWLAGLTLSVMGACGDDSGATADAGPDVAEDNTATDDSSDAPLPPLDMGTTPHCTLQDGSDPVGICIQKMVLAQQSPPGGVYYGAYVKGKGVATSWDSMTGAPDTDDAGVTLHSFRDDLAFTSSIAYYHCSSGIYGDTDVTATLDAALVDLAPILQKELAVLPDAYDGQLYLRLRNTQAGLYYVSDTMDGDMLKVIADAYGKAIQTKYAKSVPGADGGAPAMVLGRPSGAAVAYASADVVTGAVALFDMAVLHASDDPTDAQTWAATAQSAIDYVWSRARDPVTGLFYGSLVTSSDPAHDMVADDGSLLTDVQGAIILALARAQDLSDAVAALQDGGAAGDGGIPVSYYNGLANTLIDALTKAGLFDGPAEQDASTPGAYMEGLRGAPILSNKTVFSNAMLLGGLHRIATETGAIETYQAKQLRAALVQLTPPNSSFLSVVSNPSQNAYLRAASRNWNFAIAYAADGGPAGLEPYAHSYRTDAVAAMVEGMTQIWHGGTQTQVACAP
jgi:hypothetical protein